MKHKYDKEVYKTAHFYCKLCGVRVLLLGQCSKCTVKHLTEEYGKKELI
jgi:hypothetical protein